MHTVIRNRLEENYSTIYVTVFSVPVAVVLEDLVSIMRDIGERCSLTACRLLRILRRLAVLTVHCKKASRRSLYRLPACGYGHPAGVESFCP